MVRALFRHVACKAIKGARAGLVHGAERAQTDAPNGAGREFCPTNRCPKTRICESRMIEDGVKSPFPGIHAEFGMPQHHAEFGVEVLEKDREESKICPESWGRKNTNSDMEIAILTKRVDTREYALNTVGTYNIHTI